MLPTLTLIAVSLYLIASQWQLKRIADHNNGSRSRIQIIGAVALALHIIVTAKLILQDGTVNLSLFVAGSLISSAVVVILLFSSLRHKLDNLFVGAFPMAAITMSLAALFQGEPDGSQFSPGVLTHITLSILAYSLLTLAVFQALLISQQDKALKQHTTRGLLNSLPPLQVMENLLFEMIAVGEILLTLALLTGFLYTDDLFAQHLVHKTLLSIGAWVIFAVLLAGRTLFGWRSRTALRWTLSGFTLLMLAFFGSKAVLELILN